MEIIPLEDRYEELYCTCLEDWSEETREAGDLKRRWLERKKTGPSRSARERQRWRNCRNDPVHTDRTRSVVRQGPLLYLLRLGARAQTGSRQPPPGRGGIRCQDPGREGDRRLGITDPGVYAFPVVQEAEIPEHRIRCSSMTNPFAQDHPEATEICISSYPDGYALSTDRPDREGQTGDARHRPDSQFSVFTE